MDAHYRGLGAMERYEYPVAAEAFREVHEKAPGWIPGSINLAIALLNQGGEAEAKAKSAGQAELDGAPKKNIDEAVGLLDEVIARQPDNPWAHFSRGIIYKSQGRIEEAHRDFKKVTEIDPLDANAWLERGSTMTEPGKSMIEPRSKLLPEQTSYFAKALELNPYLITAMYKLSRVRRRSRAEKLESKQLSDRHLMLDPDRNFAGFGRDREAGLRRDGPLREDHRPIPQGEGTESGRRRPPGSTRRPRSRSSCPRAIAGPVPPTSPARSRWSAGPEPGSARGSRPSTPTATAGSIST